MPSGYTSKHDESKKTSHVSILLGYDAVSLCILSHFKGKGGTTNTVMQLHIPEDCNPQLCFCANLKCCKKAIVKNLSFFVKDSVKMIHQVFWTSCQEEMLNVHLIRLVDVKVF
jgi:hypothetical protein